MGLELCTVPIYRGRLFNLVKPNMNSQIFILRIKAHGDYPGLPHCEQNKKTATTRKYGRTVKFTKIFPFLVFTRLYIEPSLGVNKI